MKRSRVSRAGVAVLIALSLAFTTCKDSTRPAKGMTEFTTKLDDGSRVVVKIRKAAKGSGVVVCHQIFIPGQVTALINCSGSCGGGASKSWTCGDRQNCALNCTSGSPVGSCID